MPDPAQKLAIGTAQFGMPYGITNKNRQVQFDDVEAILNLAWGNGIDTLDTAKVYGTSEKVIGQFSRLYPAKCWSVITKLSDKENSVFVQIQDSARKLNIFPSIVMAHSADLFIEAKFQKELAEARDKLTINKVGVSVYDENEINQVMQFSIKPDVIQLPLNILDTRLYRREVISRLIEQGVEIHTRSAFLQGLFYLSDSEIQNRFIDAVPYLNELNFIASEADLTLAELSLLWLVSLEEVSKVIIGVDNINQLANHFETLKREVDPAVYSRALAIRFENENILNPSLWLSRY